MESARILRQPAPAIQQFMGSNQSPAWSPDGKYLAYTSSRSPVPQSTLLCIRSEDTGEVRELSPRLTRFRGLRWSPDGRSILTIGADLKDRRGAYLIDVETGEVIADFIRSNLTFPPDWAPEDETIVFAHRDFEKTQSQILWRDLTTGQEKKVGPVHQNSILNRVILSPDGRRLAACNWKAKEKAIDLVVGSVDGGPLRTLLTIAAPEGIHSLPWARDGKQLLFFKKLGDVGSELWAVSTKGGEPRNLGIQAGYIRQLSVHPDGKQIAFAGNRRDDEPQVWVMEDFLSKFVASKQLSLTFGKCRWQKDFLRNH